jgi:hypothetical protein
MFQEVLAAIEKGENSRARDLLTRLLKVDTNNAEYWVWMSAVVDSPRERSYCLREALRVDPQNLEAQRGLVIMGEAVPDPAQAVPLKAQKRNWQAELINLSAKPAVPKQPIRIKFNILFAAIPLSLLVIAAVVYLIISIIPKSNSEIIAQTRTYIAARLLTATLTFTPTQPTHPPLPARSPSRRTRRPSG